LWGRGTKFLVAADPHDLRAGEKRKWMSQREFLGRYNLAFKRGRLPAMSSLVLEVPRYLKPSYHPSAHGSTEDALAYLATSPAAQYAAELAAARKG
jgi:predicted metal-dependent hydrolase